MSYELQPSESTTLNALLYNMHGIIWYVYLVLLTQIKILIKIVNLITWNVDFVYIFYKQQWILMHKILMLAQSLSWHKETHFLMHMMIMIDVLHFLQRFKPKMTKHRQEWHYKCKYECLRNNLSTYPLHYW